MRIFALILAAGEGRRAQSPAQSPGTPPLAKQWQTLGDRPLLAHALTRLHAAPEITGGLLVHAPGEGEKAAALIARYAPGTAMAPGGASRAASAHAGLQALAPLAPDAVFIHDGARPFPTPALLRRLTAALQAGAPAVAPGLPLTDALWQTEGDVITGALPRSGLCRAQTPQAFDFKAILAAHAAYQGPEAADDIEVARAAGLPLAWVLGDEDNLKVTWPEDFARAARILGQTEGPKMDVRVGQGFDVHAFTPGDHVMLCGVKIPHTAALLGHSDADVALHALTDALYGALAEGDIGRHFPPSDPAFKGADSARFLAHAVARVAARGFRLSHADVTLICERPKIGPQAEAMRTRLAALLGVDMDRVSVKATTSEKLGFTGREEGIAALASATLVAP